MPTYIIRAGESGHVKIGWSEDPEKRLNELQTAHHELLSIIRLISGSRDAEGWMQQRFAAQHVRREWFIFNEEMLTVRPPREVLAGYVPPPPPPEEPPRRFPCRWDAYGCIDWSRMVRERWITMPGATEEEVFQAWRERRDVPALYRYLFPTEPDPVPPLSLLVVGPVDCARLRLPPAEPVA